MNTKNNLQILSEATKNGCKFMSFLYTPKKNPGEQSRYILNFGVDYRRSCEDDLKKLEAYQPANDIERIAKDEILTSLKQTLEKGVSDSYTQKDLFIPLCKGVKMHKETFELYLYGYIHAKEVIKEGEPKKAVKSNEKTLAKKAIEKACGTKRGKYSQFILSPDVIAGVKVNGEILEIQS